MRRKDVMKKKTQKERLRPISLYGHDPRNIIRAFMQIDLNKLKSLEEEDRKQQRSKGSSDVKQSGERS